MASFLLFWINHLYVFEEKQNALRVSKNATEEVGEA